MHTQFKVCRHSLYHAMAAGCLVMFIMFFAVATCSIAGFDGPGAMPTVTTAAEALKAVDDVPCVLQGRLEARLPARKNRYIFADDSGRIVVEIPRKVFGDMTVTPANIVRLEGEVDWSSKHDNEVEVDELVIIQ